MNNESLLAGFARLDITPPLGVHIGGYYTERIADDVLDPLYANAVAFGKGDRAAVMIVCDLLGVYGDITQRWPKIVANAVELPEEAIMIAHTHTHTGPVIDGYREPSDPMYDEWITRRLCDLARLALNDRKEVTQMRAKEGIALHMSHSRRFFMKDGTLKKPTFGEEGIDRPASPDEQSMRVIRILRGDAPEIVLVNFQTHPDNIGGCKYSADFPGALRREMESKLTNARCVYFNGAEGDQIPDSRMQAAKARPGYDGMLAFGRELAQWALLFYGQTEPVACNTFSFDRVTVQGRTKWSPEREPEAEKIIALHEAGRDNEISEDRTVVSGLVGEAYNIRLLGKTKTEYLPLLVNAIQFGDFAVLGIPGEPFCEIGLAIRENAPFSYTCVCCQSNGCRGYFPTTEAFAEGGYETKNTKLAPGIAETLTEAGVKLLKSLQPQ